MMTENGQAAMNDRLPQHRLSFASPVEPPGMEAFPSLQVLCYKPLAECILLQSSVQDVADIVESLGNFEDCVRTLRHVRGLVDPLNQATAAAWAVAMRGFAQCFPAKMLCLQLGSFQPLYRLATCFSELTHLELHTPLMVSLSWLKGLNHLCCLGLHGCKKLAGSELKYISRLRNLKALSLSECHDLDVDLDYEGLLDLPPLVSLSFSDVPAIDDRFMQYVLKYNVPDRSLAPGVAGSPAKPTLKILALESTNITQVTVDMMKTGMATPVYVDLRWSFKVPETSVAAFAAWWKLTRVRPRVLARNAAVVARVEETPFRTPDSYMRGCVCGMQDKNYGRQKLQRWLAAELLSLPFPVFPSDRASLADALGTDRGWLLRFPTTVVEPEYDPLTDPRHVASASGDSYAAYLDGDVPYDLGLPSNWESRAYPWVSSLFASRKPL